jgi:transposase
MGGRGFLRYALFMRYGQGGGLTAGDRVRREQLRLAPVEMPDRQGSVAHVAAGLRVTERSVWRRKRSWEEQGTAGPESSGRAARSRLDGGRLAELDRVLGTGPLAAGWEDQRWALTRVRDLIAREFREQDTFPGVWYLLRWRGRSCQMWAPGAPSSAVTARWRYGSQVTWPRVRDPRRPSTPGSSSGTRQASQWGRHEEEPGESRRHCRDPGPRRRLRPRRHRRPRLLPARGTRPVHLPAVPVPEQQG